MARLLGGWDEIVFIDDISEPGLFRKARRMPFTQFQTQYSPRDSKVIIAIGEPSDKKALFTRVQKRGYSFTNLIHPDSHVSVSAHLGTGIMIQKDVFVGCNVTVGDNVHMEPAVFIGHNSWVGDHCVFASKAALGGKVSVGGSAFIGLGASVRDRTVIGKSTIVGMGAVVIRDVPEDSIAIGQPAKIFKQEACRKVFK